MRYETLTDMAVQAYTFGKMNRCTQTIEECSELTKELCKYQRITNKDKTCNASELRTLENIAEEIADVEICLWQLKHLFDIKAKVEGIKEQKLYRTKQRLIEAGELTEPIVSETMIESDVLRKLMSGETNDTNEKDKQEQENLLFGKRTHLV